LGSVCYQSCPTGYTSVPTYDGDVCTLCADDCSTCASAPDACTSCPSGLLLLGDEEKCVLTCPDGTYDSGITCEPCDSSCATCSGTATSCDSCGALYLLYGSSCHYLQCPTGTYIAEAGECLPCAFPCTTCSGLSSFCTACIPGEYNYLSGCFTFCPGNTVPNGTVCQLECPPYVQAQAYFSATSPGTGVVGSCAPGFIGTATALCSVEGVWTNLTTDCVFGVVESAGHVSNLYASYVGSSAITLSWDTLDGAVPMYVVLVSTDGIAFAPPGLLTTPIINTTYTVGNLEPSSLYYFQVFGALNPQTVDNTGAQIIVSTSVVCDVSCDTCSNTTTNCTSCAAGYVFALPVVASNGTYGQCVPSGCSEHCTDCLPGQVCAACSAGYLLYNGADCLSNCPSGSYDTSTGTCGTCTAPCTSCIGSATTCLTCIEHYLLYNDTCSSLCPAGSFEVSSTACSPCLSPCATCSGGALECTSCLDGMILSVTDGSCSYPVNELLTADHLAIYILLVGTIVLAIVLMIWFNIKYQDKRYEKDFGGSYMNMATLRIGMMCASMFDTISDAFFILVVSEASNSGAYFTIALFFTILPYVIALGMSMWVGIKQALVTSRPAEQTAWFGVVMFTFVSGDIVQSITMSQTLLVLHLNLSKREARRVGNYEKVFGTSALTAAICLFLVEFLLRDIPHMIIQASFLVFQAEDNPIVILALVATIISTAVSLFSFLFFTFVPLIQNQRSASMLELTNLPPMRSIDLKDLPSASNAVDVNTVVVHV